MTPVIDTPINAHIEAHALQRERPLSRGGRPGIWHSLAHRIASSLTPMPRTRHAFSSCPFEPPMDRLVQEHPSLSLLALAIF
jgi:hypothetical protein